MSATIENTTRHQIEQASQGRDEELLRGEGGARLNGRLAGAVVGIFVALVILLTLAVQSSAPSRVSEAVPASDGSDSGMSRKTKVQELIAHGGEVTPAPEFPVPRMESPAGIVPRQESSPAPRQPDKYTQWSQDKFMKALEAPEMVSAFHGGSALQIPSVSRAQNGEPVSAFSSGDGSSSSRISLHPPSSPYTVMTGSVIPAILVSGINSDLPGPILAQVSENVYDSASGRSLLIPQGSRLIGSYRSSAGYGQNRVQIQWQRLIFPNTASMDIPAMPGTDEAGYAGFKDQVDNHYLRTFGTAALMSLISAGQAVGQISAFGGGTYGPLGYYQPNQWGMAAQTAGASASSQFGSVGQQAIQQGMSTGPTLEIRSGYQFNVMVTEDLVFPGAYRD
jgi:type IV secretory pathway VirB10-like protein